MNKLFLNAPNGVRVKRHTVGDWTYFTIPVVASKTGIAFRKLVAVGKGDYFTWIHSSFSA